MNLGLEDFALEEDGKYVMEELREDILMRVYLDNCCYNRPFEIG